MADNGSLGSFVLGSSDFDTINEQTMHQTLNLQRNFSKRVFTQSGQQQNDTPLDVKKAQELKETMEATHQIDKWQREAEEQEQKARAAVIYNQEVENPTRATFIE